MFFIRKLLGSNWESTSGDWSMFCSALDFDNFGQKSSINQRRVVHNVTVRSALVHCVQPHPASLYLTISHFSFRELHCKLLSFSLLRQVQPSGFFPCAPSSAQWILPFRYSELYSVSMFYMLSPYHPHLFTQKHSLIALVRFVK